MAVIQMPGRKGGDETGMITKWHKKTGDWVEEGDELFSFDTDEGSYTVKSQKAGRLVAVFVPEGEIVHCPADVGMLTTPSPDSVLKLGRQQYLDESKPLEAREPVPMQEPEEAAEEESRSEETAEVPESAETEPEESAEDAQEAEFSEEELLEYVEDELDEVEAVEEAAQAEEEEDEAEEPIVSEEELLQYVEEDVSELEQMDEAAEAEEMTEAEEADTEEKIAEETEQECCCEEVRCVCIKPASVTAQADMELCMDIAARTGVSLGAMVRFAAMHTGLVGYLEDVEAEGLRALDERAVLPNVRDLSGTGITAVNAVCTGKVELLVPAVHEAWRVKNNVPEVYPCLNLTLAFDENVLELEEAAVMLREVCDKLENLIELLI